MPFLFKAYNFFKSIFLKRGVDWSYLDFRFISPVINQILISTELWPDGRWKAAMICSLLAFYWVRWSPRLPAHSPAADGHCSYHSRTILAAYYRSCCSCWCHFYCYRLLTYNNNHKMNSSESCVTRDFFFLTAVVSSVVQCVRLNHFPKIT